MDFEANVKIGTCGFQKSRKKHYSELDVVEVQQTFYDPPSRDVLERWRREAPRGFEFTVKAWMLITHGYNKRLWKRLKRRVPEPVEDYGGFKLTELNVWAWRETLESARALKARIIVVQTPPSFLPTRDNAARLIGFFETVDRQGFTIAWEPRGGWWGVRGFLWDTARSAGLVVAGDILKGRAPPGDQAMLYARLHGLGEGEVNYRYRYSDEDLARLREVVFRGTWRDAYVLFNNVYAFEDATRFKNILKL